MSKAVTVVVFVLLAGLIYTVCTLSEVRSDLRAVSMQTSQTCPG